MLVVVVLGMLPEPADILLSLVSGDDAPSLAAANRRPGKIYGHFRSSTPHHDEITSEFLHNWSSRREILPVDRFVLQVEHSAHKTLLFPLLLTPPPLGCWFRPTCDGNRRQRRSSVVFCQWLTRNRETASSSQRSPTPGPGSGLTWPPMGFRRSCKTGPAQSTNSSQ